MADQQKSQVGLSSTEMYHDMPPLLMDPTVDLTDPRQWYGSLYLKSKDFRTSGLNTSLAYSKNCLSKADIYFALPPIEGQGSNLRTLSSGFAPGMDSADYRNTESLYSDFTDTHSTDNNTTNKFIPSSLPNLSSKKRDRVPSKTRSEKCDPFDEFFRTAKEDSLDYAHRQVQLEKHKKNLQQTMVEQKDRHYRKRIPRMIPKSSTLKIPPRVKSGKYKALRLPQKPCDKEKENKFRQGYVLNQKSSLRLTYGGAPNRKVVDIPQQQVHVHMWERESPQGYFAPLSSKRPRDLKEDGSQSAPVSNPWPLWLDARPIHPESKYDTDTSGSPDMSKESLAGKSAKSDIPYTRQSSFVYSGTKSQRHAQPRKENTRATVVNLYLQKKEKQVKHGPGVTFASGPPQVHYRTNHNIPTAVMDVSSTAGSELTQQSVDRANGRKVLSKYTNVNVFGENVEEGDETVKENQNVEVTPQSNPKTTSNAQDKGKNEASSVSFLKNKELSTVEVGKVRLPAIPVSRRQSSLYEKLLTQSEKQHTEMDSVDTGLEKHKVYPTPVNSIRGDSNLREPTGVSTREMMADIKETPREEQVDVIDNRTENHDERNEEDTVSEREESDTKIVKEKENETKESKETRQSEINKVEMVLSV